MNYKILALAISLLLSVGWIASEATAQDIGLCNSIAAGFFGPVGQINQGINVAENCDNVLAVLGEFVAAGCMELPEGSLFQQKLRGQALENVCSAIVDTCGIPLDICE